MIAIPAPADIPRNAKTKRAFEDGAQLRRAGGNVSSLIGNFTTVGEKAALILGFQAQCDNPGHRVNSSFFLKLKERKVVVSKPRVTKGINMRTAEELAALKAEYTDTFDAWAAAEREAGREVNVTFDEAFDGHLKALDAEAAEAAGTATETPAPNPAPAPTAKKGGKKADAKPKEPKAPKAKAFRPTADDRKALNAAALDAATKAKAEGTPRLKPASGTYSDFLSGKVLKLDEKGNGSVTLDVVTAKAMDTVVGKVDVTVKGGAMTAKGKKA